MVSVTSRFTKVAYRAGAGGVKLDAPVAESGLGPVMEGPHADSPRPMADGGRTRHHVQCAEGVDVALQILLMYASKLALDELYQPPPQSDDGFGGGDD